MKPRTSSTHPLEIATLKLPGGGRLGLTFCPGKHDPHAMTGPWERDLDTDLAAITAWGATTLVTLMETPELIYLRVADLGTRAKAHGLTWHQLPIPDVSIPGEDFEAAWPAASADLHRRIQEGEGIVIHCRGGLGRTGLVAARLLIEQAERPEKALRRVRESRPGAVETPEQEEFVLHKCRVRDV
ncbi:MAG: cyclin-dependent kinase inhibitor 3 family protein [Gammaproteobacteria bacterium]|nr:cyclin-dependent kinase inhibitor 3 family protein [Gammaproteobacteria bacterium]